MSFKEQVMRDLDNVFLNIDEFAEMHMVEGKPIPAVIDKDSFIPIGQGKSNQGKLLGTIEADMILMAKVSDLPPEKAPGSFLTLDGRECVITAWSVNMGFAEIALSQNRTM